MVASTDLKGSIPAAIKYRLACKQPALVREIAPLLQKRLSDNRTQSAWPLATHEHSDRPSHFDLSHVCLSDELSKMTHEARIAAQTQLEELISVLPVYTQAELTEAMMHIENENKQQA